MGTTMGYGQVMLFGLFERWILSVGGFAAQFLPFGLFLFILLLVKLL